MTFSSAILVEREQVASSIYRFVFRTSTHFDALPGQHVLFQLGGKWVPYSIAEHISVDTFSVYIKLIDDGYASRLLRDLTTGESLGFRKSNEIVHEFIDGPAVCIGLGTGVVPVYSIIEHTLERQGDLAVHFLYGAQSNEDLIYLEKLIQFANENNSLDLEVVYDHSKLLKDTRERIIEAAKKYPERIFVIGARQEIAKDIADALVAHGVVNERIYTL